MECQKFCWTARLFGETVQSRYFETRGERDAFVAANPGWVKRGKICAENLEKHLQEEACPERRSL